MLTPGRTVKVYGVPTAGWKFIAGQVIEDEDVALTLRGGDYDQVVPWRQIDRITLLREEGSRDV